MPGPYTFRLREGTNGFNYSTLNAANPGETAHMDPGQSVTVNNACQMKEIVRAALAANPNAGGVNGYSRLQNTLNEECAATPNPVTPADSPTSPPVETNPGAGGDSPGQQGAPDPPITGTVGTPGSGGSGGISTGTGGDGDNPAPTEEPTRPPDGEADITNGGEQPQEQTEAGDPVDIFNGAFYLEETDLVIPETIMPLSFTRFYRSGKPYFGPFGWNWDHNYNLYLRELTNGNIALWRQLHEDIFTFDGANFEPPRGLFEKLEPVAAFAQVYELRGKGGMLMHFERPAGWVDGERIPLQWIEDQHGNRLRFTYGAEDKLAEVRDDDDRFFHFSYDQCGLLVSVIDSAGRQYIYEHDEQTMHLVYVESPATTDLPDGLTRIYHYEQPWTMPQLRHNIVRVEDSTGNIYLENTYEQNPAAESFARVTEQLYGGFLFQFNYTVLQWVPANPNFINIPALRVEVMNPDYGLEIYTFNYRGDLLDRRYRLKKDNSFRVVAWNYLFDEQGNLEKVTRPDGSAEIFLYDFAHTDPRMRNNLLQKEITAASGFPAPSRIIWRGKYEPTYQQIIEEKNETGDTTTYKYDFDLTPGALTNTGKLIEVIQPDATVPDGTVQQAKSVFEYNAKGQMTAAILADGVRNEWEYGLSGNEKSRLVKQILAVGTLDLEEEFKYDAVGFNNEKIDGNGESTVQFFNDLGLPEKIVLPAVNGFTAETNLHYDADKKLVLTQRAKGAYNDPLLTGNFIEDVINRDVLGNPIEYVMSSNCSDPRIVKINNDYRGQAIETLNPDGSSIISKFDERGLQIGEEVSGTDGIVISSKKVYDRAGNLVQETNPFGLITRYEYDGFSRSSKVILPNGTEILKKWLRNDLLESEEVVGDDGTGVNRQLSYKSFTYDEKQRKISETIRSFTTNPAIFTNVTTTFFYDAMNRVVKTVDNRGGISVKQYDGVGRLILERDPLGNEQHNFYDDNGNLLETSSRHQEPDGSVSVITKKYSYDQRNRRIACEEPDGSVNSCEYDDRNLLVRQTDCRGVISEYDYNSHADKIRAVDDAGGLNITSRWTVDVMSRVTAFTDPTGEVTNYLFDSVGRNNITSFPNGLTTIKIFNSQNQIIQEQLSSGASFDYLYDNANRVSKITNSVFSAPFQRVDTHVFNYDGLDRIFTASAGGNNIERRYDSQGRLLSEESLGAIISCKYNDATGEMEKTWPDGRTEKFSHDLNGIISKIEETVNGYLGDGNLLLASFKPSGPNAFGSATYSGGIDIQNRYDDRKRVTEIIVTSAVGVNENVKYRYNNANLRQVETINGHLNKNNYYEFDNKYRLTQSKDSFPSLVSAAFTQAQHDAAINQVRIASAAAGHVESFTYDTADSRLTYLESGSPAKNYTYLPGHEIQSDGINAYSHFADGTLNSDGVLTFEADTLGRIVKIGAGGNVLTEINYDAFGRPMVVKETGKPPKSYNYLGGFVEQINENGNEARQITTHPLTGVPIAYHTTGGTHYTLFDGRYNLFGLLDSNGNLLESYRYQPFGLPQVFDAAGNAIATSAFDTEPIFGGQRFLNSCNLYLSKKRLMNPVNGTFLSTDPKGYADSSSLYVYAAQNPVNNIDPNGDIIPFIVAAFVIGGAIAGAGYSAYDAYHHPERYEGWRGSLRVFGNVFGGAAIGGLAIVGGELVLAAGGTGVFATGTGVAATTSLTAAQTFLLYGTASATTGIIGRTGFNALFPEYIDPVSPGTIATDFAFGGALPFVGSALRNVVGPALRQATAPFTNGIREVFTRAVGGNWRLFGNTWRMLANPQIQYNWRRLFWDPRSFRAVSQQYWRVSGGANGMQLHHLWFQNQSRWIPQGLRNAGFNFLEIPRALNNWMGGRIWRELSFRAGISTLLTGVGVGSYQLTSSLLNGTPSNTTPPPPSGSDAGQVGLQQPNEKPAGAK